MCFVQADLSIAELVVFLFSVLVIGSENQISRTLIKSIIGLLLLLSNSSNAIKHLSPLFFIEWSENKTKSDLTLASHQLSLDESDELLEEFRESLEYD